MKALDHLRNAYMQAQTEMAEGKLSEKESLLLKSCLSNMATAVSRMEALYDMTQKKMLH